MLGITLLTFVISQVVPADPAVALAGDFATQETIAAIRAKHGLDKPLPMQYVLYLKRLVRGDLGLSIFTNKPVTEDLAQFFPATLELSTAAILLAVLIGLPAGVLAATHRNGPFDHASRILALVGASMPVFWLGLLFSAVFYYYLGWLPAGGRIGVDVAPPDRITGLMVLDSLFRGNWVAFSSALRHLVLPALTLGCVGAGMIARVTRSSMLEVLGHDYVKTARAKGLSRVVVTYKHALKNALLPTVTVVGLTYGALLGGAVLTESVFSWPGLGRYAVASMLRADFPAVMGVTLLLTIIYSLVNLLVDLLYAALNPTIRYE
jgi:peptide/nickel transport system permease protein